MSDELKSALELAMEKLDREMGSDLRTLSEEQKALIADVRSRYSAKAAEAEIATQSKIQKAVQSGDYEAVEKARQNLADEKQRLERAKEKEIEKIHSGS